IEFPDGRTWTRATRFPVLGLSGSIGHGITLGGGFATYLDKSYDLSTRDTVDIRGVPVPVIDRYTSDGAVSDLRLAAAVRISPKLFVAPGRTCSPARRASVPAVTSRTAATSTRSRRAS